MSGSRPVTIISMCNGSHRGHSSYDELCLFQHSYASKSLKSLTAMAAIDSYNPTVSDL